MHSEDLLSHQRCHPLLPEVGETEDRRPDYDKHRLTGEESTAAPPTGDQYTPASYGGLGAAERVVGDGVYRQDRFSLERKEALWRGPSGPSDETIRSIHKLLAGSVA